uniref:Galectin n=1 Tax=Breviceps mossambicus TaxID=143669 RepID=A0AAU7BBW5_9NEOB
MGGERVVFNNLEIKPGKRVEVKGYIPEDCKDFSVNLGKDENNLILHANARFDFRNDKRVLACNSLKDCEWGEEVIMDIFPFQLGTEISLSLTFDTEKVNMIFSTGEEISFPVRFELDMINYVALRGLIFRCLTSE